jgi:hypothetical protein
MTLKTQRLTVRYIPSKFGMIFERMKMVRVEFNPPFAPQRRHVALSRLMTALAHLLCLLERLECPPFQFGFFSPLVSRPSTPHSCEQNLCFRKVVIGWLSLIWNGSLQFSQIFARVPPCQSGLFSPAQFLDRHLPRHL